MRGYYSAEEQAPDPDLGKSLREGWRNTEASGRVSAAAADRQTNAAPATTCLHGADAASLSLC